MNNLMDQNQVYFFLHFIRGLGTPAAELIVIGGETDPLDGMLTIAKVSSYDEAMKDPDFEVEPCCDFIVNGDGEIIRRLSYGLQLSDDFDRLEPSYREYPERLWKLQQRTDEGMLMYPDEIQIIDAFKGQYLIKPQREFVRLETFKQMLRCLPWVKMYTLEELRNKSSLKIS